MSTVKKKISLTVDYKFYDELKRLQQTKGKSSLSSTVLELTKEALELEEDIYFDKIASQREREGTISHKSIWKKSKL